VVHFSVVLKLFALAVLVKRGTQGIALGKLEQLMRRLKAYFLEK
jgi:hypothetical protein